MPDSFSRVARLHPAQVENRSLARRGRLIALGILAGLLISALASVAIWAIVIQKTAHAGDFQLLLPLALLLLPVMLWQVHRHLSIRPRLRITPERIEIFPRGLNPLAPARRVDASGVQSAHLLRDADGLRLVLSRQKAPPVVLNLLWDAAPDILGWLARIPVPLHDGPRTLDASQLQQAWLSPDAWKESPERQLDFAWHFNLPFLYGRILARRKTVTAQDLERYYRLLRTWADFLFLQEAASDVARCLPDFALPREDRFRIACVLRVRQEMESALHELANLPGLEEIPPELLEEWRTHLKYRNLPPLPYSGMATRLLSGVSHFARVRDDGTLETRDGTVSLKTFVAARLPQRAFNTAPLELHDILGRTSRINQDEAETLRDVRRMAPHVLYIHAQSYISLATRMQLRKIIRTFLISSKNKNG